MSHDEWLRRVREDILLEKENGKLVEKQVEMLACHVRDLEGQLWKYEDIPKYIHVKGGLSATDHEGGVLAIDDVHSIDEHHPQSAKKACTHE